MIVFQSTSLWVASSFLSKAEQCPSHHVLHSIYLVRRGALCGPTGFKFVGIPQWNSSTSLASVISFLSEKSREALQHILKFKY